MSAAHLSSETLIDLADDALDPPAIAEAEAHLAGCASCRGELETLRRVNAGVVSLDVARLARRLVAMVPKLSSMADEIADVAAQESRPPRREDPTYLGSFEELGLELHWMTTRGESWLVIIADRTATVGAVRARGLVEERRSGKTWMGRFEPGGAPTVVVEIDAGDATLRLDLVRE